MSGFFLQFSYRSGCKNENSYSTITKLNANKRYFMRD